MKSSETIIEPTIYERPIATEPTLDSNRQPNMIQDYENVEQQHHTYKTKKSNEYESV